MCVLQSPMSTGIVQYIRKSFFGPQNVGWGSHKFLLEAGGGGYGPLAPSAPPPMVSQSAKHDKKKKRTSMQSASSKRAHEGRRK